MSKRSDRQAAAIIGEEIESDRELSRLTPSFSAALVGSRCCRQRVSAVLERWAEPPPRFSVCKQIDCDIRRAAKTWYRAVHSFEPSDL